MANESVKKSKARLKPNKKWTEDEIGDIIEYIQEEIDFEKPTAQIYYKKLIEKGKINATWDMIRWEVRYLKMTYKKAEDWRNSTGAGLLEADKGISSVKDKLKNLCPYYFQLKEVFGEKVHSSYQTHDTMGTFSTSLLWPELSSNFSKDASLDNIEIEFVDLPTSDDSVPRAIPPTDDVVATPCTSSSSTSKKDESKVRRFTEKLKKFAPKNSLDQLTIIYSERNEMQELKINLEKEKIFKEFEIEEKKLKLEERKINEEIERRQERFYIEEKKLKLEEKKINEEMELRRLDIAKDEKLKILELEKQERLQKYEIEMKYKYKSK